MTVKPKTRRSTEIGRTPKDATGEREVLHPIRDRSRRAAVMDATSGLDLKATTIWHDIALLSDETLPDGVDAVPEGIFSTGQDGFVAVATGYVTLNFNDGPGKIRLSESFPLTIRGRFKGDGTAVVERVDANTAAIAA